MQEAPTGSPEELVKRAVLQAIIDADLVEGPEITQYDPSQGVFAIAGLFPTLFWPRWGPSLKGEYIIPHSGGAFFRWLDERSVATGNDIAHPVEFPPALEKCQKIIRVVAQSDPRFAQHPMAGPQRRRKGKLQKQAAPQA